MSGEGCGVGAGEGCGGAVWVGGDVGRRVGGVGGVGVEEEAELVRAASALGKPNLKCMP